MKALTTGDGTESLVKEAELVQPSPIPEFLDFHMSQIPAVIFGELSMFLGTGPKVERYTDGHLWTVQAIDPTHPVTGFAGAIGYYNMYECHLFGLWTQMPKGEDSVFEPRTIFELRGGPSSTGRWSAGKGEHLAEDVTYKITSSYGCSGRSLSIPLQAMILVRMHQLVLRPECLQDSYWQSEFKARQEA